MRAVRGNILDEGQQHSILSSLSLRGQQDPGEGESQSITSRYVGTKTAGQTEQGAETEAAGRVPDTGEQAAVLDVPERGAGRVTRMHLVETLPAGTRMDSNTDRAGRILDISLSQVRTGEMKRGADSPVRSRF